MKYLIYIQDKQERINTAAKIFTFLNNSYTYTPLNKDIMVGVVGKTYLVGGWLQYLVRKIQLFVCCDLTNTLDIKIQYECNYHIVHVEKGIITCCKHF